MRFTLLRQEQQGNLRAEVLPDWVLRPFRRLSVEIRYWNPLPTLRQSDLTSRVSAVYLSSTASTGAVQAAVLAAVTGPAIAGVLELSGADRITARGRTPTGM